MNGKYLLDTNIIISIFAQDLGVHSGLATAQEVFIPSIAVGELYYGAFKSLKKDDNLARISEFVIDNTVLACDTDTAKRYGAIKNRLKEKGQPLPENDIWIAAIAQQYALILVTRDSHFDLVENLEIESW